MTRKVIERAHAVECGRLTWTMELTVRLTLSATLEQEVEGRMEFHPCEASATWREVRFMHRRAAEHLIDSLEKGPIPCV